jgi:hypothetical protein
MLEEELKPTVYSKCRRMLTNGSCFASMKTLDLIKLQQLLKQSENKFKLLSHPVYSPDLITIFALHRCQFTNNEEVRRMWCIHGFACN